MTDLQHMSRILYHHEWVRVEDWAQNFEQLADLSDEEIVQLESSGAQEKAAPAMLWQSHRTGARLATAFVMRTRRRVATWCGGLRLSVRRAC